MNEANTKKLYTDFPRLYRDAIMNKGCMKWGFECNDGWFDLVYKLSGDIEAEATALGIDRASDAWPLARQVKEKFGTLKFYCAAGEERDESDKSVMGLEVVGQLVSFRPVPNVESIHALIQAAEELSATICEDCGCPGTLRGKSYISTLCDECEAKRKTNVA